MFMRPSSWTLLAAALAAGCARNDQDAVVVYCALDQMYAEPILRRFEAETDVRVLCVYDAESVKTTGLVNRLLAEGPRPQADVFWNNEVCQTIRLKAAGRLTPYRSKYFDSIPPEYRDADGYWCGFAARARVLIYNRNRVAAADAPRSIFDLAQPRWRGKVAIAYPLFGTTYTHVAALFAALGPKRTLSLLRSWAANDVKWVDGNATVKNMVGAGELFVGLTDTDDANAAIEDGQPIAMVFPDADGLGTLVLPNTVALIKGGPHPANGKKLIDFLLRPEVETALAASRSAQIPLRKSLSPNPRVPPLRRIERMHVSFDAVAARMPDVSRAVQSLSLTLNR